MDSTRGLSQRGSMDEAVRYRPAADEAEQESAATPGFPASAGVWTIGADSQVGRGSLEPFSSAHSYTRVHAWICISNAKETVAA